MNIAEKLRTSRDLMKSALRVMRSQPRLFLFPLLSGTCTLVMAAFFFAPVAWVLFGEGGPLDFDLPLAGYMREDIFKTWAAEEAGGAYAYGALIYLVSLFAAAFFNVAFYHQIMRALAGETVSLRGGLRFACSRASAILWWSLLAGTVGLVIRAIEERLGWVGRLVLGFVGMAWSVAAVFAIPVIVRREERNPLVVLRDSAGTLKRMWGESIAGFVGIQVLGALAVLGVTVAAVALAIGASALELHGSFLFVGGLWLIVIIATGALLNMATHVYRCALYVYASEGVVPEPYSQELMDAAWKVKTAKAN